MDFCWDFPCNCCKLFAKWVEIRVFWLNWFLVWGLPGGLSDALLPGAAKGLQGISGYGSTLRLHLPLLPQAGVGK